MPAAASLTEQILPPNPDVLRALLEVSLTGVILFRPVYGEVGEAEITDFAYDYLSPAAQRMLAQPERPAETFLTLYPSAVEAGIFAFYRDTFLSGKAGHYNVNYQADGLDNYFHLAARRAGAQLVVSFTDTADHDRTAAEQALRDSHAREREVRAAISREREQLLGMFEQAPAMICIFDGPQHVFQFVNPPYQALVGARPLVGKPIAVAMPELAGQPIFDLLDKVYQTGETFYATEMLVQLDHDNANLKELEKRYYNFIYQARRTAAGVIDGILVFAYEVTPQVLIRQQIQDLNEELAAANEELQAANEEFHTSNTALNTAQLELQQLNQQLEARVQERTREAERQSARLERFFMQAPAGICILDGPDLVFELVNPVYQSLFPSRLLHGLPILQAMPEIAHQPVYAMLRRVYATGETHEEQDQRTTFIRPEDGQPEERYFNYIQQARYDENGQIDGLLVFAFEVTAQVQARQRTQALQAEVLASAQRLAQERETYYQVFEQTPAALCILRGPEHRVEYHNEAYQQLFLRRQMRGFTVAEMQPEAVEQGFVALLDKVYRTGETYFGDELPLEIAQPDGRPARRVYFNFTYQPYRQDGEVVGISVFAYDVTMQAQARQQIQNLNEELAAINEELAATNEELQATNDELGSTNNQLTRTNADLDTFVYTASHDLRAPITNIEGLLQTLLGELPPTNRPGDVSFILDLMQGAVDRFKTTIGHLTDISRLQQMQGQPATQVHLADVIHDVRLDLTPLLAETQGILKIEVNDCPTIAFSEKNLRSIVYNLLSNALKYHHPDRLPEVRIRCRQESEYCVLMVEDNGLGIAEAQQSRIFSMFQRFHTHVEGSGIGLYMVKKMVENAGGYILVDSEVGLGSAFSVFFPR